MTKLDKALYIVILLSIGWNLYLNSKWISLVKESYNAGYKKGVYDMTEIITGENESMK